MDITGDYLPSNDTYNISAAANVTDNVSTSAGGDDVPSPPAYIIVTATAAYVLIFVVGVSGNGLVISAICLCRSMKTTMNMYLANLCVADILLVVVCMPTSLVDIFTKEVWYFGGVMCKVVPFLENTVANASVLTILAISIERYRVVCYPLKGIDHRSIKIWTIVIFIWIISAITSAPFLYISFLKASYFYDGTPIVVCRTPIVELWQQVYVILLDIFFFLIPCVSLVLLNCRLCCVLHRSQVGMPTQLSRQDTKRRQHQVTKTLTLIVSIFFVCHLPFRVAALWFVFEDKHFIYSLGLETYLNILYSTRIMFYLNHALNPVLYNFFSTKFRMALRGLCRRKGRSPHATVLSLGCGKTRRANLYTSGGNCELVSLRKACYVKDVTWTPSGCSPSSSSDKQVRSSRNDFFPQYDMLDRASDSRAESSSSSKECDLKI